MTTALRHREVRLCQDVLAVLRGELACLPAWDLADVQPLDEATGLLPLAVHLGLFDGAGDAVSTVVDAARHRTAADVAEARAWGDTALTALTDAGIAAVLVGDVAMVNDVWPHPECRVVASIDLVVAPHLRARAVARLADALPAAATDRVRLHGGWTEHLHGYTVDGCVLEPATFDHVALTAHALGALSVAVVRGDVRAVDVVDLWYCTRQGFDWVRLADVLAHVDPRLSAPGLWLLGRLLPGLLPEGLLASQLARLPRRGRQALHRAHAVDVLRDPSQRPRLVWRDSFAETLRERKAVVGDMLRRGDQPHPR